MPVGRAEAPSPPDRTPRDYTPKHLADKILQSKSALEGERKQVTVLFADVKGSLELAEQVDPEEWHRILDRFFQILADGVHRFEGTVNQYTGDGIMALFGAPIAHEDHAQRACYAALHLRDALRRYAEELKRARGLNFYVRMGLNSGEVVVGKIGDDLRMDYTAQGQVVSLAERIEQLAPSESAYLTEYTAGLVSGFFELRDLEEFHLKGVATADTARLVAGTRLLEVRGPRGRHADPRGGPGPQPRGGRPGGGRGRRGGGRQEPPLLRVSRGLPRTGPQRVRGACRIPRQERPLSAHAPGLSRLLRHHRGGRRPRRA
jgi:class 3 adenylate cyclase